MKQLTKEEIIIGLELISDDIMVLQGEALIPPNLAEKMIEAKTILSNVKYEMKGIDDV